MKNIHIEEISNVAVRDLVASGKLDDPERLVTRVFQHRYSGRQCDWGYIDKEGYTYAYFGGDEPEFCSNETDLGEDFNGTHVDDLEIFDEWMPSDIKRD